MADNKFKKYLWLLNIINSFGPVSFNEINSLWKRSILNSTGEDLPKKTFHNFINAISDTFEIEIQCERKGGYKYYVEETLNTDTWTRSYLNSLLLQFSLLEDNRQGKVFFDVDNDIDADPRINFFINCIINHLVVSFKYVKSFAKLRASKPHLNAPDVIREHHNFAPLGLVHVDRRWFVVGKLLDTDTLAPFSLQYLEDFSISEGERYIPSSFSTKDYISKFSFSYSGEDILIHANDDAGELDSALQFSSISSYSNQ